MVASFHKSADRRPQRETDTKRRTDHAERAGTLFFGSYVGDVSEGGGNAGSGNPGDDATEKQPPNGGGDCHDDVVETEAKTGKQKDRSAAKPIGQNADHGRKKKLHRGEYSQKNAIPIRRACHVVV